MVTGRHPQLPAHLPRRPVRRAARRSTAHGIAFAADALAAGAVALLTDPAGAADAPAGVPLLVVAEPRRLLGRLAARVYGEPATAMRMVGVTGTQGKTTTTRLAEGGLERAGVRAGVIGTVGTRIAGEEVKTSLTTPEAPDLHALFALMREREVEACAMEVSSHALVMGRVDGVVFDVAVFLNLGRDHLDFHADEEDYYRAKASLFTPERARLRADRRSTTRTAAGWPRETTLPVRTFSTGGRRRGLDGQRRAAGPGRHDVPGARARGRRRRRRPAARRVQRHQRPGRGRGLRRGRPATTRARRRGRDRGGRGSAGPVRADRRRAAVHRRRRLRAQAGRRARPRCDSLRPLTDGRLLVVLGAGGDRDLGQAADHGRDRGPARRRRRGHRRQPPHRGPGRDPRRGARRGPRRRRARCSRRATGGRRSPPRCGWPGPGDIVVVAGKGHETGQEVAGVVHPFDDREVVRELLAER